MASPLEDSIRFLRGVGPRRAEDLERLGIRTLEDLLLHVPRRYFDRTRVVPLRDLAPGDSVCVRVRVEAVQARPSWRGRGGTVATVADDTGRLRVVWYTPWTRNQIEPGNEILLAGTVAEVRGRLEMRQPEFERVDAESQRGLHAGRIVPLYGATRGVSQKLLRALVDAALERVEGAVPEILPAAVRGALPGRAQALRDVHYPAAEPEALVALERLKLEELFCLELLLLQRRALARARADGIRMPRERGLQARYLEQLPFRLTAAQDRVLEEILADLESGHWMQRLVLGDVGAGKTVLAVGALLAAVGNGCQGAFLAPTEPLALQHAARLVTVCAALGVRLGTLCGSMSERDKAETRARIGSGDVDLVIGTHALLTEGLEWKTLGVVVIDEQQRFGVQQRGALLRGARRPHVLLLSATPIPRSLALTLFGDLDVSRLDEKPAGREAIRTHVVPEAKTAALWDFVRGELQAGRQAFVVLPVIDDSEKTELRAATEEFARLRAGPLAGQALGLLHGRVPAAERETVLQSFRRNDTRLLVCTSIVEVGLDIANASVMVIHHPERFGLAQLHQMRGRVGRGTHASYCFLLPGPEVGDPALDRLRRFAATDDGFTIAELDLELRGPGDLAGIRQHGIPALRVADVTQDLELLLRAREYAAAVVARDASLSAPEHALLRAHLETHWADRDTLAGIG